MALPCSNLNLNLYRVFYTVAKTKSFSESSRTLHISQPAISKHIQNLEYELNTLLFYRTNRGIELTPEAKALLVYVEKAWNFLMLGEKQLQESKDLLKGKISIGTQTFISNYYLNDYIKQFMKEHPSIIIKIANQDKDKLLELLHQHTLDMLIIADNLETPKDLKTIPLEKEHYCFAYNKEKINADEVKVLEDLAKVPLILPVKNKPIRKKLEEFINGKGIVLEPIMELEDNEMILNYVKEGLGVGYILTKTVEKNPDLEIVKLDEELPHSIISLIYNENTLTSSSKEFIKLLSNVDV